MENPLMICFWYDGKAKEAAEFYCTVFKNSKLTSVSDLVVTFELNGMKFMGLNGGPQFKFNEAISVVVSCDTQKEIDHYWNSLTTNGGQESMCGWLKDKFGLSWQIVPSQLGKMMSDPKKGKRVMDQILKMRKLDIQTLENA
jgi:predicted 3-demethylubiquinone-9 3-methyltransferase (glyoxalase superfamily)